MKASEIMTRDVVVVHPDTSVRDAADALTARGITSAPVVDDDGHVVGIVSEGDLIRGRMPHDLRSHLRPEATPHADPPRLVGEVMCETVVCMAETADTADLAELMINSHVRAVPIVDGKRLAGIVSRRDLLRTLVRDDAAVRAEVRARLADYAGRPDPWNVDVDDGVVTVRGHFAEDEQRIVDVLARSVPGVIVVHCRAHRFGPSS